MLGRRSLAASLFAIAVAGATPGCGSTSPNHDQTLPLSGPPPRSIEDGPACGQATRPPVVYGHVIWIWMENHSKSAVLGSPEAPFETSLAQACGTATDYHDVGSPSLPNHLGATSGSTWGIHDDAGPTTHPLTADNLFRQVRVSGGTERSYEEDMPAACTVESAGTYAVKHNPAAYYVGGDDRTACQADDLPMGDLTGGAFVSDLQRGTLPSFAFVTPNLCNDTHDCSVGVGDRWLSEWIPRILSSAAYQHGGTAIFVVWDEPTPMPNIIISPTTPPGTRFTSSVDHYALLHTTEDMLGLASLAPATSDATSMRAPFGL